MTKQAVNVKAHCPLVHGALREWWGMQARKGLQQQPGTDFV